MSNSFKGQFRTLEPRGMEITLFNTIFSRFTSTFSFAINIIIIEIHTSTKFGWVSMNAFNVAYFISINFNLTNLKF